MPTPDTESVPCGDEIHASPSLRAEAISRKYCTMPKFAVQRRDGSFYTVHANAGLHSREASNIDLIAAEKASEEHRLKEKEKDMKILLYVEKLARKAERMGPARRREAESSIIEEIEKMKQMGFETTVDEEEWEMVEEREQVADEKGWVTVESMAKK